MPQQARTSAVDHEARAVAAAARLKVAQAEGQIETLRELAVKHDKADEERTRRIERDIDRLIATVTETRRDFSTRIDALQKTLGEATGRVHARIDALVRAALSGAVASAAALTGAILYQLWQQVGG